MIARYSIRIALLVSAALAGDVAAAAYDVSAVYPVKHLNPEDAKQALWVRNPELTDGCLLNPQAANDPATAGFRGTILVQCKTNEDRSKVAAALAAIDVAPPSQRFHVVVLSASRKEGPTPELPAGEAKALADFKKVMSYKSFTFEAETMIASEHSAETQLNESYRLEMLVVRPSGSDVIDAKFRLMSLSALPQVNGAQGFRTYLDTSFTIKVGETIVLGSSTSDQAARVVLVTAVP